MKKLFGALVVLGLMVGMVGCGGSPTSAPTPPVKKPVVDPEPKKPIVDPEPKKPIVDPEPKKPIVDPEPKKPIVDPDPKKKKPVDPDKD